MSLKTFFILPFLNQFYTILMIDIMTCLSVIYISTLNLKIFFHLYFKINNIDVTSMIEPRWIKGDTYLLAQKFEYNSIFTFFFFQKKYKTIMLNQFFFKLCLTLTFFSQNMFIYWCFSHKKNIKIQLIFKIVIKLCHTLNFFVTHH